MYTPILDWYRGEYMLSRINVNNGLQEPTCRCQNCNTRRNLQTTIKLLNIKGKIKLVHVI